MKSSYPRKTQLQHAEASRRHIADRMDGFAFLLATHAPTQEELAKLRAKRPALWDGFPDKAHT